MFDCHDHQLSNWAFTSFLEKFLTNQRSVVILTNFSTNQSSVYRLHAKHWTQWKMFFPFLAPNLIFDPSSTDDSLIRNRALKFEAHKGIKMYCMLQCDQWVAEKFVCGVFAVEIIVKWHFNNFERVFLVE